MWAYWSSVDVEGGLDEGVGSLNSETSDPPFCGLDVNTVESGLHGESRGIDFELIAFGDVSCCCFETLNIRAMSDSTIRQFVKAPATLSEHSILPISLESASKRT